MTNAGRIELELDIVDACKAEEALGSSCVRPLKLPSTRRKEEGNNAENGPFSSKMDASLQTPLSQNIFVRSAVAAQILYSRRRI
jgi:hypothetical protein